MTKLEHFAIEKSVARAVLAIVSALLLAPAVSAQFVSTEISTGLFEPSGVVADADGIVYISDSSDNCIAKYDPTSGSFTTLAGTSGTQTTGTNSGFGSLAQFSQPRGIVAARGGLVVVDQGNQLIRFITFAGDVSNLAGIPGVVGGQDGPGASATFSYPNGIVADAAGNIFVADEGNDAIRMIDTNNVVSTVPVGNYKFSAPAAVALDNKSNIWVADTGHDVICLVSNNTVSIIGGVSGFPGDNDSPFASTAHFNLPSGLIWSSAINGFLVSDTGNDTLRELFLTNFNGAQTYSVQTIAGIAGDPGFIDGAPDKAQFNGPIGLAIDSVDSGYFVADAGNNAVRVFEPSAPQPPVSSPQIGFVVFVRESDGSLSSVFNPVTSVVFNNPAIIAVEGEIGTETYMTYGPTPTNALVNTILAPGPLEGSTAPLYPGDGTPPPLASILAQIPDLTIEVIGEASGRKSSPLITARFQFITANPTIQGDNPAAITLTDGTTNADMWYTLNGAAPQPFAPDSIGPVSSGTVLTLNISTNTTLSVAAFADDFAPSGVARKVLSPADFSADKLTFGFQSGEASSKFIAAAGQRFVAPVTLSLISSGDVMYSLQFDAAVTNITGPHVATNFTFQSMLMKPFIPNPLFYVPIPPAMASTTNAVNGVDGLLLTNVSEGLLEIGWLERPPEGILYPTTSQTLISFSQAHDTLFHSGDGRVIVGAFSFVVPSSATIGETYGINLANGSATSDGISAPVFIQTVSNGSLAAGPINSQKIVTVGTAQYLVGDAAPFGWFNAGDFGDTNLQNNDVVQVFQTAIYGLDGPPLGSDFFDAMDSSDGTDNNYYDGNDKSINLITNGDGILAVDDVYVTFRRSLDPDLTWYDRFWSNGHRQAVAVPNTLQPVSLKSSPPPAPIKTALSGPRYVTVAADQVKAGASLNLQVPVRVLAADTMPIRVAMLGVEIDPLDGSPPITNAVTFTAAPGLATSNLLTYSVGPNMYGTAFLDSTVPGVSGQSIIGTFNVTLPPNVTASSAYLVHFDHFSASPNGIALFHSTVQDGLITVTDRSGSSWNDGIPDNWRLQNFGTVSNPLSAANADPDGDGASNWQEYIAGTNPLDGTSVFRFGTANAPGAGGFVLQWPTVANRHYTLQSSSSIDAASWTTVATNMTGNGQPMQWTDTAPGASAKFYRALVQ